MLLSWPGAGVGGGERTEDLFWLPGHVRVGGAAFMLQDRDDSVGGEIKIAVRVGRVPGLCFPEVARYLAGDDAPARAQVRECVANTIAQRQARIVIAHSLGTVVAYEALHAHPDLKVDLLVTLGSPLALPDAIFHRLQPRSGAAASPRPANVRRWVNISDYGDPIAILRPFTRYFPDVDLDLTESVGLFDFHRAARYLACASLASLQPLLQQT